MTEPRMTRMCLSTTLGSVLVVLLVVVGRTAGQPQQRGANDNVDPETSASQLIEPAVPTIERGLAYLARQQQENGAFGQRGYNRNAAVCALAGMAFLAAGNTPDRGPYGEEVSGVVDYLLANTDASGFISVQGATSQGPMYSHGFATLFLAETYGMSPRDDLRDKLEKAIELIVRTQNSQGGWRYQPRPDEADISVTICQIMALRAARNAGLHVPNDTVDRCIDFVKQCQNPDGGFCYMLPGGPSLFPRSAAGVVALNSAGIYEGTQIDRGLGYLDQFLPRPPAIRRESHFFYGHYYAVQAMWQAGGQRWNRWYPAIRDLLMARQQDNGSWTDTIGPIYGTAMACIVLEMPNNCVPIFQR